MLQDARFTNILAAEDNDTDLIAGENVFYFGYRTLRRLLNLLDRIERVSHSKSAFPTDANALQYVQSKGTYYLLRQR